MHELAAALDAWAPPQLAEGYDNVGLLLGSPQAEVSAALISLELTEAVVDEALAKGCQCIIAHHPIWFGKRTRLTTEDWVGRLLLRAAKEGLNLFALHTNLDAVRTGVNHKLGDLIGVPEDARQPLRPGPPHPNGSLEPTGHGMCGLLPYHMEKGDFMAHIKHVFQAKVLRVGDVEGIRQIEKVAWCGGSGSFLLQDALAWGADAYITGDVTHHTFFDHEDRMLIVDVGHYESEQFTPQLIHAHLSQLFPNFAFHLSHVDTNPITLY